MPFTTDRIRNTPQTRRRDENVRQLVAAMRGRPMLRDEIGEFIGSSKSGTSKYIALLRDAGVIVLVRYLDVTSYSIGHALYRLSDDAQLVDAYLKALGTVVAKRTSRAADPTRTRHLIVDECHYRGKPSASRIPAPDPVLAAFFGLAPRAEAAQQGAN